MNDPAVPITSPDGVRVWSVPLAVSAQEVEAFAQLLTADERQRASSFAFERDAHRFIAARAMLRTLLADRLGRSPHELRFDVEPGTTKPRLVTSGSAAVAFNLSHSADRALVAIAEGSAPPALGVDLELIEPKPDLDRVARRFFSQPEREALASISDRSQRIEAFYACWTRKEAVLKGVGDGLTLPLDEFDVDLLSTGPFAVHGRGPTGDRVSGWLVHPLDVGVGWAAAIALPGPGRRD